MPLWSTASTRTNELNIINVWHFLKKLRLLMEPRALFCPQEHTSGCDRCGRGGLQDEKHANYKKSLLDESGAFLKQTSESYRFIFDVMGIFCVAGTVVQENYLAEGQIPL
eukprot:1157387-Pelagomonas_calceolata.AAC.2